MPSEKRILLFEKTKPWDYVDSYNYRIWLNKYGDIIKIQSPSGVITNGPVVWSGTGVWTVEIANDLQAYHGIDVEAELTAILSEEIAQAIDREILIRLLTKETVM